MARDDERAARIEHDVIGRKWRRHARAKLERLRRGVPRIKQYFAERRRGDRYVRAVGGDRDAVREGDVRGDDDGGRVYVYVCGGRGFGFGFGFGFGERDVGCPGEREREDRFGDGEGLAEDAGEAPREAVVVREVERRRARERERVGRDEVRAGERADPLGAVWALPREGELLDRAVVPRVVHDEEVGVGFVGLRRVDVEPQGMEVLLLGIPFQRDTHRPRGRIPDVVEPERPAGGWVVQRAHDCVPRFAAGVAAEQHDLVDYAAGAVDLLPESGVLAVFHVIRPDDRAMLVMRALGIVAERKVRGGKEDVSRTTTVPPEYEPLGGHCRSKASLRKRLIHTRKAVTMAQDKEDFMILGSGQSVTYTWKGWPGH